MGVKVVAVDGPNKRTGKVIYICEICNTEKSRRYKTPKAAPPSSGRLASLILNLYK
jgi:hypothetical protein